MASISSVTPFLAICVSSSLITSSKVKPYWKPEQPPPCTKTRSFRSGLPSSSTSWRTLSAALSVKIKRRRHLVGGRRDRFGQCVHGSSFKGTDSGETTDIKLPPIGPSMVTSPALTIPMTRAFSVDPTAQARTRTTRGCAAQGHGRRHGQPARPPVSGLQRLLNCLRRRAPCRPTFLRSTSRASRVTKPARLRSGLSATS